MIKCQSKNISLEGNSTIEKKKKNLLNETLIVVSNPEDGLFKGNFYFFELLNNTKIIENVLSYGEIANGLIKIYKSKFKNDLLYSHNLLNLKFPCENNDKLCSIEEFTDFFSENNEDPDKSSLLKEQINSLTNILEQMNINLNFCSIIQFSSKNILNCFF